MIRTNDQNGKMKLFALSTNAALTFCVLPTVIAFLCPNTRNQKSLYLTDSQGDFASKPIKNDTTADIVDDKFLLKTKSENNALTDRFKYKVNALMGTYDPPAGADDTERVGGGILNAMMNFPAPYTFTVICRAREEAIVSQYVTDVNAVISKATNSGSATSRAVEIIPRGAKYTRVSITAVVENASIIASIFEELASLELTVMRY